MLRRTCDGQAGLAGLRATCLVAVCVALLLSGCSSGSKAAAPTATNSPAPNFTGPYASEFRNAWVESNSSFVQSVIIDEKITDQEWAEVAQRLSACLKAKGLTFKGFRSDGSYSVDTGSVSGDQANADLAPCERQSGEQWIGYLRNQMATNPNNTPIAELMAACLVRLGAVAPGYSKDDYLRDNPTMSFPYLNPKTGKQLLMECNTDPSVGLGH